MFPVESQVSQLLTMQDAHDPLLKMCPGKQLVQTVADVHVAQSVMLQGKHVKLVPT